MSHTDPVMGSDQVPHPYLNLRPAVRGALLLLPQPCAPPNTNHLHHPSSVALPWVPSPPHTIPYTRPTPCLWGRRTRRVPPLTSTSPHPPFSPAVAIWAENLEYALAHNARTTSSYWLGLTPLADLTQEEYRGRYLGFDGAAHKVGGGVCGYARVCVVGEEVGEERWLALF